MVEAVAAIPASQLLPGEYTNLANYVQSLNLPKPDFIANYPVVVRLEDNQRDIFESSLSEPTPTRVTGPNSQSVSRFGVLQLALGASIGKLLSIPDVRDGAVVQDIFPKEASRLVASSSYGSEAEFVFHNDLSFLDDSDIPDFVTLGCVRNTEGAATVVACVEDIIDGLSNKDIAELQKVQYEVRHTYHRGSSGERVGQKQSAVILPNYEICLGVDMATQTPEAHIAINSLRKLLHQVSTKHQLLAGEVLVLPNRHAVHARDPFTMSTDVGKRRWLQRINISA